MKLDVKLTDTNHILKIAARNNSELLINCQNEVKNMQNN